MTHKSNPRPSANGAGAGDTDLAARGSGSQYNESQRGRPVGKRKRREFDALLARLPYGEWTCSDGSRVLFNRRYMPMWQRKPDGTVSRVDPNKWVDWVSQRWFYNDDNPPRYNVETRVRLVRILAEFLRGAP